MSLNDQNEEYEDLLPKQSNFFKIDKKKIQLPLILLIVGLIIGILLTHYYIEPFFNNTSSQNSCNKYIQTNEVLNKENECLYQLLENSKDIEQCNTPTPKKTLDN